MAPTASESGGTPQRIIRKRFAITNGQRKALRDRARSTPRGKQKDLCSWFRERYGHTPSQGTVSESLSKRYDWLDDANANIDFDAVKLRPSHWPELEEALIEWYRQNEGHETITSTTIADRAALLWHQIDKYKDQELPQFSNGWVDGFKRRNGIKMRKNRPYQSLASRLPSGTEEAAEAGGQFGFNAGHDSDMDYGVVSDLERVIAHYNDPTPSRAPLVPRPQPQPHVQRPEPRHVQPRVFTEAEIIEQVASAREVASHFNTADVYICDETKLFWNQTADHRPHASEKDRMLNVFCCNADGSDKLPLWLIGAQQTPREFEMAGININALNCIWKVNDNASLQFTIMRDWLRWFDKRMTGRKALLFMDDLSIHQAVVEDLHTSQQPLQNTSVYRLPPESPENFESPTKNIVRTYKAHYRKRWLRHLSDQLSAGKDPLKTTNILHAVRWAIQAWTSTSSSAIHSCWIHSTLISTPQNAATETITFPSDLHIPETTDSTTEIQTLLTRIQQQSPTQLQLPTDTDIATFISPPEESYTDTDVPAPFVNVEMDSTPRVSVKEALTALETLRRYEEQACDEQVAFIQHLDAEEERLRQKEQRIKRQEDMSALFNLRA